MMKVLFCSLMNFPILLGLFCIAIDAPGGFLFEWWSVFWDIFIARTNEKHSEVAASYIEVSFTILPACFILLSRIELASSLIVYSLTVFSPFLCV